jgi:TfoX/Sxy family transcriptional regulator of competence genes
MAYDEDLAHRIRELLAGEDGVSEMSMFGGLAFLLAGNMAVAASGEGGLLARVGLDAAEQAIGRPHVRPMEMRARPMHGWVRVGADGVRSKRQLQSWVRPAVAFARTLPPKG